MTAEALTELDWTRLSDQAQVILARIAVPIYLEGRSREELASDLGRSRRWINRALDLLDGEIRELARPVPPSPAATRTVSVYADEDMWKRWMVAAYQEGMRLSDWAAAVVDREARRVLLRLERENV